MQASLGSIQPCAVGQATSGTIGDFTGRHCKAGCVLEGSVGLAESTRSADDTRLIPSSLLSRLVLEECVDSYLHHGHMRMSCMRLDLILDTIA